MLKKRRDVVKKKFNPEVIEDAFVDLQVDAVVIGSGPAGQKAAIQIAKLNKKVVVVERDSHPGGTSLNSGTIPSKSLREAILDLTGFYKRAFYGKDALNRNVTISDLNYRLNKVLEYQRHIIVKQFSKNNIRLLSGSATFVNPYELQVTDHNGEVTHRLKTEKVIIASGSKPRNPNHVPFDETTILDSTRLLAIDQVPKTMCVLGGGVIGSEYASYYAALGTKVTVVDKRDRMLPLLDKEVGTHFTHALSEIGLEFIGNKEVETITKGEHKAVVTFSDKTTLEAEILLYALGRVANVDSLGIQNAELSVNARGYIPVNPMFETAQPHIYAVGDVIGGPCLASTSMEQGRLAARYAFGAEAHPFPTFFPIGIYTIPEISSVGHTEEELKQMGYHYEVGRAYYYEIARNQIAGNDPGMFKILFHADTLEILGIHIIGRSATEVIHIGQVAMSFNARIDYFIDQVFNYPTYAEGYRIAALNGYNKVKHKL